MATWKQFETFKTFTESCQYGLDGVYTFALVNQGNKAVTINGNLVLVPGASWADTNTNPEIAHYTVLEFAFDKLSPVTDVAGKPGSTPTGLNKTATPDATPIYRLVLIMGNLQKV